MADDLDNPRDVELSALSAIYPEIQRPRSDDPYTIALDVPVNPSNAVTVFFPAAADDATLLGANGAETAGPGQQGAVDSHELAHLPSVHLKITLGPQYPTEKPPQIAISTNPPWLPAETVRKLEDDAPRLWEEMGRDIVGFTYIDHVQQAADNLFGLVDDEGSLEVDPSHKIAILDYDIKARRAAFEKETFHCGVCLGMLCRRGPTALSGMEGTEPNSQGFCFQTLSCALNRFSSRRVCFPEHFQHVLTFARTQERFRLPSDDGLRARLLRRVLAGLLQQRHQGRRYRDSQMPVAQLCQRARKSHFSIRQETQEAQDLHQP